MPDQDSVLQGTAVRNSDVAAFTRKYGPASFSKPNGPDQTILYYPAPPSERAEAEEFENYAGKRTPGTRSTVVQGRKTGSQVTSTEKVASASPSTVTAANQNLNAEAKRAEVGEIDAEEATTPRDSERGEDAPEPTREQEPAADDIEQVEPDEVDPSENPEAVESEVVKADQKKLNSMTKAELLEVARDTELEGRSDMTKDELLSALKEERE